MSLLDLSKEFRLPSLCASQFEKGDLNAYFESRVGEAAAGTAPALRLDRGFDLSQG